MYKKINYLNLKSYFLSFLIFIVIVIIANYAINNYYIVNYYNDYLSVANIVIFITMLVVRYFVNKDADEKILNLFWPSVLTLFILSAFSIVTGLSSGIDLYQIKQINNNMYSAFVFSFIISFIVYILLCLFSLAQKDKLSIKTIFGISIFLNSFLYYISNVNIDKAYILFSCITSIILSSIYFLCIQTSIYSNLKNMSKYPLFIVLNSLIIFIPLPNKNKLNKKTK